MDTVIVKRVILFAGCLLTGHQGFTQLNAIVNIGSIDDNTIKTIMDENAGKLLTEINSAFINATVPSLAGINMTPNAKSAVLAIWETSQFRCMETEIIDDIFKFHSGDMQLRNIPLYIKEADSSGKNQEGVLVFTKTGTIDNFFFAIGNKQWEKVMKKGKGFTDLTRREIILDFVENFRTAYNRKDIDFLRSIFSINRLEITDKIIKDKDLAGDDRSQNFPKEKIIYNRHAKSEYMASMQRIFVSNSYINIKFKELKVVQHKQLWSTSRYYDAGYIFLLIDLEEKDSPKILISTWQPGKINGKKIHKSEVFNISSFAL